jgi:hypothetical protein
VLLVRHCDASWGCIATATCVPAVVQASSHAPLAAAAGPVHIR